LLTVLFRNPNFLILDEPTNDLDLPTLAVLEQFLVDYPGCVMIVSHDRYFMDRLVDHLFVFEGDGVVRDFPGNYTQYRLWQKEEEKKQQTSTNNTQSSSSAATTINTSNNITVTTKRKLTFNEKREFDQLEKQLPALEKERAELAEALTQTSNYEAISKISDRLTAIATELETKEMRWLELSEFL
jgi:ATP-binding cassette subfamily F protein uup